jgi:hypothetical protein
VDEISSQHVGFTGLFGFRVDSNDGPNISTGPVARHRVDGQFCSSKWIREKSDIISEIITTRNSRDTNYVHQGWSLPATTTATPWMSSRIAGNNQIPSNGWVLTKRTTVQRLTLDIPLEDLVPVPEFEIDIQAALEKPTDLGKYQSLERVFQRW